jgi:hypothetical protein
MFWATGHAFRSNFAAAKLEYELRKLLKGKVAAAVKYKKIAFCKVIFVIFANSKNKRYE